MDGNKMGPLPADHAAHHMVAHSAKAAAFARSILDYFDIGINSHHNGVYLPKDLSVLNPHGMAVHSTLHTNAYYSEVTDMLRLATTREEAVSVLNDIRTMLQNGWSPR
jgi:hypothetical protein